MRKPSAKPRHDRACKKIAVKIGGRTGAANAADGTRTAGAPTDPTGQRLARSCDGDGFRRHLWVAKGLPCCAPRSSPTPHCRRRQLKLCGYSAGRLISWSKVGGNRQELLAGATQGRFQQLAVCQPFQGWADERIQLFSHGRCDAVRIGRHFAARSAWCRARSRPAASNALAASAAPVTSGCVSCWCLAPPPAFALPGRGVPAYRHGYSLSSSASRASTRLSLWPTRSPGLSRPC